LVKQSLVSLDPSLFESGLIGLKTADYDEHFGNDIEATIRMVLDVFVSLLPDNQRNAVQMCIMANLTYEEAAERISLQRGKRTDKKTVWRWARAGAEQLRLWLSDSSWVAPLTDNKIPVDRLRNSLPFDLPWEESNG
jgi:hypothetical protein